MKRLSMLLLAVCVCVLASRCSEDDKVKDDNKTQDVTFKFDVNGVEKTVVATFKFSNTLRRPIEISGSVNEIKATDESTGKRVYVYTYKLNVPQVINGRTQWSMKTGYYGYSGGCFYWGTLITGDNGAEHFNPHSAAYNPPICPGGEWAFEWVEKEPCDGCDFPEPEDLEE